jgi:diguanylate cyclase (GGDEF)-like protein/PAS domain S-box-containing protein
MHPHLPPQLSARQLRAVFDGAACGLVVQDVDARIVDCNAAAERLLGLSREQLLGRTCVDPRWHATDAEGSPLPGDQHPAMRTLATGEPIDGLEMGVCLPSGERRWILVHTSLLPDEGQGSWVVSAFVDNTAHHRLRRSIAEDRERLLATLAGTQTATWDWNVRTGEVRITDAWGKVLGYTLDELQPLSIDTWTSRLHPDDAPVVERALKRHFSGESDHYDVECRMRHRDGNWRWVRDRGRLATATADGRAEWMYGTHEDITERKTAQLAAEAAHALLRGLFDMAHVGISLVDMTTGRAVDANQALCRMLHCTRETFIERGPAAFTPPEQRSMRDHLYREVVERGWHDPWEMELVRSDGQRVPVLRSGGRVLSTDGRPHVWALVQDISRLKSVEHQLRIAATHDRLTGLPNRNELAERLHTLVERLQQDPAAGFSVMLLDFDRFKFVNDTLGHAVGDELLKAIGERLTALVTDPQRDPWLVARLGGDEFVVLAPGLCDADRIHREGERLLTALAAPYPLAGKVIRSSASIGVAVACGSQATPDDLLRDADIAMYEAKQAGRGGLVIFDADMRERLQRRVQIEHALHGALAAGQMHVVYQPIVDLATGETASVEALVRWHHPEMGEVSPAEFIPIAEDGPHILAVGEWVLREACRQWSRWQRQSPQRAPSMVSVNLSRVQLAQGDRLIEIVRDALADAGMPAAALQLEITEREMMRPATNTADLMRTLRAMGVRLAMDDFGTGASSLGCLREFPFDTIKIDKSFVTNLTRDLDVLAVASATVTVIENLGMKSVAEGVEEVGEMAVLQGLGCRYGQGWLFGRPVKGDVLLERLPVPPVAAAVVADRPDGADTPAGPAAPG